MTWPLSQDYNEAIQNPASAFSDPELRQGEPATNALGLPMPRSGNFADVYEVRCPKHTWAVKCFTRKVPGLRERYREITAYLRQVGLPFMVDFSYLDEGIRIRGQWYPVLKMHWVEGFTLNEFVRDAVDKPQVLDAVSQIWVRLSRKLREAKMAHCDLQHGNVLLVQGSKASSLIVKLIDYDGMFVPALARSKSGEVGHPAYQHPQRLREGTYNKEIDRFPHLVIYCALRSLIVGGRPLWDHYDNGDNLLFRQKDLEAPRESALFDELLQFDDPQVRELAQQLSRAASKPLEQAPLLEDLVSNGAAVTGIHGKRSRAASTTGVAEVRTPEATFAASTAVDEPVVRMRRPTPQSKNPPWLWISAASVVAVIAGVGVGVAIFRNSGNEPSPGDRQAAQRAVQPRGPSVGDTVKAKGKVRPPGGRELHPGRPQRQPQDKAGPPPVLPSSSTLVLTKTRWAGGIPGKGGAGPFEDTLPGDVLVGFETHFGKDADGNQFIAGIAPMYESSRANEHRTVRGRADGPRIVIHGGEGYAVAGMVIEADSKIYGFKVVFMRVRGQELDPKTADTTGWWGGHGGKQVKLAGDGQRVVGIYGNGANGLERLGLVQFVRKFTVTDPAALTVAAAWVDKAFRDDLAESDPNDMRAVADKLLTEAGRIRDLTTRYVVLTRAREVAQRAGDLTRVFSAVDQLAAVYHVGSVVFMKAMALDSIERILDQQGNRMGLGPKYRPLLRAAQHLSEEAVAKHEFDLARRLLLFAQRTGQKAQDQDSVVAARQRLAEVEDIIRPRKPIISPPAVVQTLPVPKEAEQAKAEAEIKELFQDDYARRKPADRLGLAAKLFEQGAGTKDKPAAGFVLLREARDLAAEGGDAEAAFDAIGLMAQRYTIDPLPMKEAALERAARTARTAATAQAIVSSYVTLIDEAIAADRYEAALALLAPAEAVGHRATNASFISWLRSRKETVNQFQKEFERLEAVRATLRKDPTNPAANSAMGRFVCLVKGEWAKGLPMLSAGNDRELKTLAAKDLENPTLPAEQAEVADAFYERAQAEKDTARLHLSRRACHWYQGAAPGLDGLTLTKVEKRIKELERLPGFRPPEVVGHSRRFEGHTGPVLSVAVAPDGHTALSGSNDKSMRLWDLDDGTEVRRFNGGPTAVRCVGFDPDGGRALSGGVDGNVHVWDLKDGQQLRLLFGFGDTDVSAVFLPHDRGVLLAGRTKHVRIWPAHGNGSSTNSDSKWNTITCLAVSADGQFALFGMVDGTARLWRVEDKRTLLPLVGRSRAEILSIAISRDGRYAASGCADKTVGLWDLRTGREVHRLKGHAEAVTSVAFSRDGRRLLSGSDDKTLRLLDVKTGQLILRLSGHRGPVRSVALTPDGRHALSASEDKTVRLWVLPK